MQEKNENFFFFCIKNVKYQFLLHFLLKKLFQQ